MTALLTALGVNNKEVSVPPPKNCYEPKPEGEISLRQAFSCYYDLKTVSPQLISFIHERTRDQTEKARLSELLQDGGLSLQQNQKLKEYIEIREVADVFEEFPSLIKEKGAQIISEVLGNMKVMMPRYYSISSTPTVDQGRVSVTADVVRYQTLGKQRTGVTTTFLADRVHEGDSCYVFVNKNPEFRLPG